MRRVSVTTPEGKADEVAQIAFSVGISAVSVKQNLRMKRNGSRTPEDALEVDTSTPLAKAFIDKLTTALLLLSGITVALLTGPPLRFDEFSSLPTSLMISLIVGVAAGLATADDVGRREMIGLAATAQIAILPTWFGICFVLGFPPIDSTPPVNRGLGLLANVAVIIL